LFAVLPHIFPVLLLREFRCEVVEFPLQGPGISSFLRPELGKYPVFSRESGKYEAETGSPMTASTAKVWLISVVF